MHWYDSGFARACIGTVGLEPRAGMHWCGWPTTTRCWHAPTRGWMTLRRAMRGRGGGQTTSCDLLRPHVTIFNRLWYGLWYDKARSTSVTGVIFARYEAPASLGLHCCKVQSTSVTTSATSLQGMRSIP
eukprot:1161713-Pelagomonas_calceolata.AAC.2